MRITIVTPAFNARATIEETLASVRAQDHPDVEHIVVDGGSTDGTVDVLRATDGVRWVSEPDRGLSHAMNKGIAMATSEVIGELNADDRYRSGALAAVAAAFAASAGAEWVTGRCPIIDANCVLNRAIVFAYRGMRAVRAR